MSTTKINLSLVEKYICLELSIENLAKEKLIDLGDSYLLKINKRSKSGNELYFSMLFNKKVMNKVIRSSNPSITISKNKDLISLTIKLMVEETEVYKEDSFYWIKKEYATSPAFEISYKMNESYYHKKTLSSF